VEALTITAIMDTTMVAVVIGGIMAVIMAVKIVTQTTVVALIIGVEWSLMVRRDPKNQQILVGIFLPGSSGI